MSGAERKSQHLPRLQDRFVWLQLGKCHCLHWFRDLSEYVLKGAMTLHGIQLDPEVQAKVVAVVTYGVSVLARRVLLRSDFAAGPNHRRSP